MMRFAEGEWSLSDVATSPHMYDGPVLDLRALDDFRVYGPGRSVQPGCEGGEIAEWRSGDQGQTWRRTAFLTSGSPFSHNHVKAVHNQPAGDVAFRLLWSYGDGGTPPSTKEVPLYWWGDGLAEAKRIETGEQGDKK